MTPPDATTIQTRLPVWVALSDLFLDTELQPPDLDRIAAVLAASPYPDAKLEEILRFEVSPILKWNLFMVAGEWGGFDADWLRTTLTPRIDRPPRWRWPVLWMIRPEWLQVKARLAELRSGKL